MLAGIWTLYWSRRYQCSALTNWTNIPNGSWLFQSLVCIAKRDEGQLMNVYSVSLCYVLMLFLVFSYTCILFCVWLIIYVQFNFSCYFCHLLLLKLEQFRVYSCNSKQKLNHSMKWKPLPQLKFPCYFMSTTDWLILYLNYSIDHVQSNLH